ncbi:AMP-binding protein, partial [Mucilaginibacter sp. RCC_168]|uniref:AMP-binding protein n=1 Tax=Mucilaginibacter sp. RCC_168 TaxID=3239221 RepID=UPI003523995F
SASEREELLSSFSHGAVTEYGDEDTVVSLFESTASLYGERCALTFGDKSQSYRDLNERSNMIGHYLRGTYGIVGDDLIGIMTDRSDLMIAGILGILKSGAGYVPIDPDYPMDRRLYMLQDSGVKCVLVVGGEGHGLGGEVPEVDLLELLANSVPASAANLPALNKPSDI